MLAAEGCPVSEAGIIIESVDETLAVTDFKDDPFRIVRASAPYVADGVRQSCPAEKIQDVVLVTARLVLLALLLFWLLLRSCGVLRKRSKELISNCLKPILTH